MAAKRAPRAPEPLQVTVRWGSPMTKAQRLSLARLLWKIDARIQAEKAAAAEPHTDPEDGSTS